jgi:hypothetical protein
MSVGALQRLVDAARSLPGEKRSEPRRWPVRLEPTGEVAQPSSAPEVAALRRRVGALLDELAQRTERALDGALRRAASEWDQVDALTVLDRPLLATVATLRREADALHGAADPAAAAAGLEALLTVGAAVDLVALLERRLATLVRLRLRGDDRELLPDGRPFLDLAAALREATRGWA